MTPEPEPAENDPNPYLDETYSRERLLDLLHLAKRNLSATQLEHPTSPEIIAYQTTILWLSLALAFKRK